MKCINIENVKTFMSELLVKENFDRYFLCEAEIVTFNKFTIDGHVQKKFYSGEEYKDMGSPQWSTWERIRPLCFEMIKGSRTPLKFKIVLRLNEEEMERMLKENELSYKIEDIGGLYLNIVYENNVLNCITGSSMNVFTMDKSLEKVWDMKVEKELSVY